MMTTNTEVGISPVLLQAITQTLADPNQEKVTQVKTFCDENGQQKFIFCRPEGPVILKHEAGLGGVNIKSATGEGDTIIVSEGMGDPLNMEVTKSGHFVKTERLVSEGGELVVEGSVQNVLMDSGLPLEHSSAVIQNEHGEYVVVAKHADMGLRDEHCMVVRNIQDAHQPVPVMPTGDGRFIVTNGADDAPKGQPVFRQAGTEDRRIYIRVPEESVEEQQEIPVTTQAEVSMGSVLSAIASHHARLKQDTVSPPIIEAASSQSEDGDSNQQQIIIYTQEVPVAGNDIAVANSEVIISDSGCSDLMPPHAKRACLDDQQVILINDTPESMQGQLGDKSSGTAWNSYVKQFTAKGPCPICGDQVSGYHYGIYCCESCKGFFKRTIQNKKSFACHRKDDCNVLISSRKKCPACRFKKCIMMGMKVEAVRTDRARGGRSVYDGCSPHAKRPMKFPENRQSPVPKERPSHSTIQQVVPESPVISSQPNEAATATSPLVAILSGSQSGANDAEVIKPMVPQLVMEIMNLESILCSEEEDQNLQQDAEENFYTSLLQIADQRLYKIVRWARSLPDFAIISTDDQILLLQNAWADLLCLDCCWRSLQTPNEIKLSYSKSIDLAVAREIGAEEIVNRMMQLTEHLHRIQLDMPEFACLKVLILMSPDVKGLKDISHIRGFQEKVTDALMVYSSTHYPHQSNKFGELLLRLPELAKLSCIGKEMLGKKDLPAEISSFSLLMELLKTNPPT